MFGRISKYFGHLVVIIFLWLLTAGQSLTPAFGEGPAKTPAAIRVAPTVASVFMTPALFDLPLQVYINMRRGDIKGAQSSLGMIGKWFPLIPDVAYAPNAIKNRKLLSKRILQKVSQLAQSSFLSVGKIPRKRYLQARKRYDKFVPPIEKAISATTQSPASLRQKPMPRLTSDFNAMVDARNTGWDPRLNVLKSLFSFDVKPSDLKKPIGFGGAASKLVNEWYEKGLAAGNYGDLYDNRDSRHSLLRKGRLPQLTHITYGPEAKGAQTHYGLNNKFVYNAITIGNSSTARGGKLWRSLPRIAMTTPNAAKILYLQYVTNQLYFYPEHRDHDPKFGDVMPANTPYLIISQGSSGSDQPFIQAAGVILAAFKPKVKETLKKAGMIMPTLQMIFRRGQKNVNSTADYLSGKAHPTVFNSKNLDLVKMVKLANALKIDNIPPMVGIQMVEENVIDAAVDPSPADLSEKLFDTPGAIARTIRSTAYEKRMLVRASYKGVNGLEKVSYDWRVLRGDASRIKITPRSEDGSLVEILVPWHERMAIPGQSDLTSDRVDIGVFVGNGSNLSAPAFISLTYPAQQKRTYGENGQVLSIDYQYEDFSDRYADPLLFPKRAWLDIYQYDDKGMLIGWKRQQKGKTESFTRHGAVVTERDSQGRAIKAQSVRYVSAPTRSGHLKIEAKRSSEFLSYKYLDNEDRIGSLVAK